MRKKLKYFVCFGLVVFISFVHAEWTEPVKIEWGSHLNFDVDPIQHKLHVLYVGSGNGSLGNLYYSRLDTAGNIEIDKELVPTAEKENYYELDYWPVIAIDPSGRPHIVYRSKIVDRKCDLFYNVRNTNGWGTPIKIANQILRGYNVSMDVDNNGIAHIVYTNKVEPFLDAETFVAVEYNRIVNGGIVYSETVTDTLLEQRFDSALRIVADLHNNIHLPLGCPNLHEGLITYFRKGAMEDGFTRQQVILHDGYTKRHGHPDIATDQEGNVHFCYGVQEDPELISSPVNSPSMRYVRFENNSMVRNVVATKVNELQAWTTKKVGWGLGSIATSKDGIVIGIAYQIKDQGQLRARISQDRGVTWGQQTVIADGVAELNVNGIMVEGRDMQLLRSDGDRFFIIYPSRHNEIMLSINKDVRIAPAAPTINDVSVRGTTTLKLTMDDDLAKSGYNIYRGTSADFVPDYAGGSNRVATNQGDMLLNEDGVQWMDLNVIGDASINYFYVVTGLSDTKESEPSGVVGEFEYDIVTTGTTSFNPIGLAMNINGVTDAAGLLTSLSDCNSVAKWDATTQNYIQYIPALPNSNFQVIAGYPYYVNATSNSILTMTGAASDPAFTLYTTNTTDYNDIMLPLDRSDLVTARDLAEDIGAVCDAVVQFNVNNQSYLQYDYDENDPGFDLKIGSVYKVNVTEVTIWPVAAGKMARLQELQSASPYTKAPHTVRGRIENGENYSMKAYIKSRQNEIQTDLSYGSGINNNKWVVQVGNFKSAWKAGDTLRVEFSRMASNELVDFIEIPLTYQASDFIPITMCSFSDMDNEAEIPKTFEVSQNYPNPFNGHTSIHVAIPEEMHISIVIFDVLGKQVRTLYKGDVNPGYQSLSWDGLNDQGRHVGSGIYFYKVITHKSLVTNKMILMQ